MADRELVIFQKFFDVDVKVKKEMLKIAPPTDRQYIDKESISKYTDNVNDSLIYIFSELKSLFSDIFGSFSSIYERVVKMEKEIMKSFYSCGYNIDKLRLFNEKYISNMDIDFINSVKEECVGYSRGDDSIPFKKVNTVNELLHYLHSCLVNNDYAFQTITKIDDKVNDYNNQITFRGYQIPVFEQLFYAFPNNLYVGTTDIVAINERKMIMMVRDIGHAMTIEISLNNDIARVEYFIPKLCNIEMINRLPGINKVNEDSIGATGVFEVPISELTNKLFDFISRVPADGDMVFKNHRSR